MTTNYLDAVNVRTSQSLRGAGHIGFPPSSRFLMLPRRPARAARAGLALYEAVEPKQRIMARVGQMLTALGLTDLLPATDRREVCWDWWIGFVAQVVEPAVGPVHCLAFRVPGNPRVSALMMDDIGRPRAFAKLLNAPQPEVPAAASVLLSAQTTQHFRVPATIAEGTFQGSFYRLLEPLPEGLHAPPPYDPPRLWRVVDELHERLAGLARPQGVPRRHVVCHADLTPRNLRIAADGQWWLFDWDNVRWGPRLADELRYWSAAFAYRARPHVERDAARVLELLRRRGTDEEIREALTWPDQVRQTYRMIEPQLYAAVGRALNSSSGTKN